MSLSCLLLVTGSTLLIPPGRGPVIRVDDLPRLPSMEHGEVFGGFPRVHFLEYIYSEGFLEYISLNIYIYIYIYIYIWKLATKVGLTSPHAQSWKTFIEELSKAHVRLAEDEDVFVWVWKGEGCSCKVSLGYEAQLDLIQNPIEWWWKKIRQVQASPKSVIRLWFIICNRLPTWERLQRKHLEGLDQCCFCRNFT
jgi:hypothetical protein